MCNFIEILLNIFTPEGMHVRNDPFFLIICFFFVVIVCLFICFILLFFCVVRALVVCVSVFDWTFLMFSPFLVLFL